MKQDERNQEEKTTVKKIEIIVIMLNLTGAGRGLTKTEFKLDANVYTKKQTMKKKMFWRTVIS